MNGGPDTRPRSPMEVEPEMQRISDTIEQETNLFRQQAQDAARAEADYKLAHAQHVIRLSQSGAKMSVGERDARALDACGDQYRAYKLTAAVSSSTQESLRSLRARLEALRTESANRRYTG